jgi:hypothetical protein
MSSFGRTDLDDMNREQAEYPAGGYSEQRVGFQMQPLVMLVVAHHHFERFPPSAGSISAFAEMGGGGVA